jgi:hypothetical protein
VCNIADGLETSLPLIEKMFWTSHFFSYEAWFYLSGSSTPKTAACGRRLIRISLWRRHCMAKRLVYVARCHEANWPHIPSGHYQLWTDSVHFIRHLNKDDIAHGYFQQDVATLHMAHVSMTLLRDVLREWLISRGTLPSRSPNLSPLIFICGKQWNLQSTKTFTVVSDTWRKPSLKQLEISPVLN